jgi:hypothetical protein
MQIALPSGLAIQSNSLTSWPEFGAIYKLKAGISVKLVSNFGSILFDFALRERLVRQN